MTPYRRLAMEMSSGPDAVLAEERCYERIKSVLDHLHSRAVTLMNSGGVDEALEASEEYMLTAQAFTTYGTALIAYDDIEESEIGHFSQDDDGSIPEDAN